MWMPLLISSKYKEGNMLDDNNTVQFHFFEFKWTSFEKRNNMDELVNIPSKAEERSSTQI